MKHCCCGWCAWCLIQYEHNINISLFHCTGVPQHIVIRFSCFSSLTFDALRLSVVPYICSFSIQFYFILWQIFHSIEIEVMLKMQLNFHATISFVVLCFDTFRLFGWLLGCFVYGE